jgi:hypothetical protein
MVPDTASIADLARVVAQVRPGHPVTTAALTLELRRGAVGKPSDGLRSLMERLADPAFRARLFTEAPLLRQLTYRCDGAAPGEKAFRRRRWTREERRGAVVDLSNLLWTFRRRATGEAPRLAPVIAAIAWLRHRGLDQLIGVGDANLLHVAVDADDPESVHHLEDALDRLVLAPGGVPADPILLDIARDADLLIVSNDTFREWRRSSTWRRREIWRRRVPLRPHRDDPAGSYDLGEAGWELLDPPEQDCPPTP